MQKKNIPHVVTWHTYYYDYKHYLLHNFLGIAVFSEMLLTKKFCGKKVAALITPSNKIADYLKNTYKIYQEPHIIKTGTHINVKNIHDEKIKSIKNKFGIHNDEFILMFCGRLAKEKNIEFLIESERILNNIDNKIKLLIVGDGPEMNNLKKLTKQLKLENNVIFTGKVERDELIPYYKISAINVTASNSETQGLTIMESFQNDTPVCCINDSAYNYIVKNNYNGKFFNSKKEYVENVIQLKNNSDLLEKFKFNALKSGNEYDNIKYAKEVLKIYNDCLQYKMKSEIKSL